jgi:hypothetical protein
VHVMYTMCNTQCVDNVYSVYTMCVYNVCVQCVEGRVRAVFPRLGLRVEPVPGNLLIWPTVGRAGQVLHCTTAAVCMALYCTARHCTALEVL